MRQFGRKAYLGYVVNGQGSEDEEGIRHVQADEGAHHAPAAVAMDGAVLISEARQWVGADALAGPEGRCTPEFQVVPYAHTLDSGSLFTSAD